MGVTHPHNTMEFTLPPADGVIKLWDVRMVAEITTIAGGKYPANKAAFDASGAVGCGAKQLQPLVSMAALAGVSDPAAAECHLCSMRFAHPPHTHTRTNKYTQSQVLAVASDDGRIRCYSTATGDAICELTGHEDAVQAVAFDRGGQFLVSASSDCTFKLWGG